MDDHCLQTEGLFTRLLNLHARFPHFVPEEDFFTEQVAYLFETSPDILQAWLVQLGWDPSIEYRKTVVKAQAEYKRCPEHYRNSRPDISIERFTEAGRDLIFIESKLGARERPGQLRRYAEVLNHEEAGRKWLIYITREDMPKARAEIFQNIPDSPVIFKQLHWRDFYYFLKRQQPQFLSDEILHFMKENGMEANQVVFTESDLSAMSNLRQLFRLMHAVLDNIMQRRFQSILGSEPMLTPTEWMVEDWSRFALEGYIAKEGLYCGLGFNGFTGKQSSGPQLYFFVEIASKDEFSEGTWLRAKLVDLLLDIQVNQPGWTGLNLDQPNEESSIYKTYALSNFIQSENIVHECQNVLNGYLDELIEIKRQYPNIPWNA